jgi:serine protease Do
MSDFYEFNEKKHSRRMTLGNLIVVGLICLLIGAVGMYFILPLFGGDEQQTGNLGNDPTPSATITATPSPSPTPDTGQADSGNVPVLGARGDVYISGENPVVEIAQKVGPAVVAITNSYEITMRSFFGEDVTQEVKSGGSGIIISKEGYIVTNNHVVEGEGELTVKIGDIEGIPAELIGTDPFNDVAVVKIDPAGLDLTVATIGNSDEVQVGELAVAIGNPGGQDLGDEEWQLAGSVTVGIISGLDRRVIIDNRELTLLQTDAAINPGNSGGALVNAQGQVIGMNAVKFAASGVEGIGFAIPSNVFKDIASEIIQNNGDIKEVVLGVSVSLVTEDVSQDIIEQYGIPEGLHVVAVTPGGAAEKAGIRVNDVIVSFDGQETKTKEALLTLLHEHEAGDVVPVVIWRNGNEFTVNVTLMAAE